MNSKKIDLQEQHLSAACEHIQQQFATHSWWPTAQPAEAKREFELMKGSATALNVWCEKWLSADQCQKLSKKAV